MAFWRRHTKFILLAVFLALYFLQVAPRITGDSVVNDETWELTSGYYFWNQVQTPSVMDHPPLALALEALPLYFFTPQTGQADLDLESRAYQFFYVLNQDKFKNMVSAARCVDLFFGLGIGCLLFFLLRNTPNGIWFFTMGLWAFEPSLLALSGYAKTDIPLTFLFFAAVLLFNRALQKPGLSNGFWAGVVSAMAITAKLTGLILAPIFILLEMFSYWKSKRAAGLPIRWLGMAAGSIIWIPILYLPQILLSGGKVNPFALFGKKLEFIFDPAAQSHPFYFLGQCSEAHHGLYYPAVLLLKCTLPFLILLGIGLFGWLRRRLNLEPWVWVSPLVYLVLINGAPNLGTRYLLPAFPFFLLIGGKSAAWLWNRGGGPNWKGGAGIALLLLLWHGSETLACFPGHLSYFNELVPSRGKIHFLGDWNLDVSQDHERLAALARVKGWSNIKLAYLGGTDPYFYGLRWRPWTEKDLSGPQRGTTYLVNAAFLQEAPCFFSSTLPIAKSWISNLKQDQRLGDTWYYVEGPPGTPEEDKTSNLPSVPVFKYVWNLKTNQREKP